MALRPCKRKTHRLTSSLAPGYPEWRWRFTLEALDLNNDPPLDSSFFHNVSLSEIVYFGAPVFIMWQCNNTIWALWKLTSKPVTLSRGLVYNSNITQGGWDFGSVSFEVSRLLSCLLLVRRYISECVAATGCQSGIVWNMNVACSAPPVPTYAWLCAFTANKVEGPIIKTLLRSATSGHQSCTGYL